MVAVNTPFPINTPLKKVKNGDVSNWNGATIKKGTYVFFAVVGAFTPTCSSKQVPGYAASADLFKAKGVDEIFCLSVNDPFVLQAWEKELSVDGKVTFLADGNGELTRALDMDVDLTSHFLGTRSKRYAMIIKNGLITHLDVEENPGECTISAAESLLSRL